jgi:xylulokinase
MSVLLAIDLGTESVRACLVAPEGRIVDRARRGIALSTPQAGWAEQDPEEWWAAAAAVVRELMERSRPRDVAAVGVCGQMHGPVPIGADGALVPGPVQLWCDKRAAAQAQALARRRDVAALIRLAGNPPTPAWLGFKIAWEKRCQPDRYTAARVYLPPKDFLNFRLTGVAGTDYSEASGTFLMDARRRRWSPELCEALGVDPARLPPIREAREVIGAVTAEAAVRTGLPEGTPVVAGGGDMLALLLGAGITRTGRACDTTGTASVLSVFRSAPVEDPRVMNLHHVVPGWIAFGICDSGGGSLRWFRDLLAGNGVGGYDALDHAASAVPPGAGGLFFFPYLQGERTLGAPHARGTLIGLTPAHGQGAIARAIMEGVTFELRRALEVITAQGLPVQELRTIGGGARSALWSAIKADVYGLPVWTLREFEGGVLGRRSWPGRGSGSSPTRRPPPSAWPSAPWSTVPTPTAPPATRRPIGSSAGCTICSSRPTTCWPRRRLRRGGDRDGPGADVDQRRTARGGRAGVDRRCQPGHRGGGGAGPSRHGGGRRSRGRRRPCRVSDMEPHGARGARRDPAARGGPRERTPGRTG